MAGTPSHDTPGSGRPPIAIVIIALLLVLLVTVLIAAATGSVAIGLWDTWTTLLATWGLPVESTASATHASILTDIRFPRMALAAAAGAALALAGVLLAGAFRNPLAEPATTGTAAGAIFGTSLALFLLPAVFPAALFSAAGETTLPAQLLRIALAALFAFGATLLVWTTARTAGTVLSGPLLLGGLAVNALVGAAAALVLFIAPIGGVTAAGLVVQWIFGGLLAEAATGAATGVLIALAVAALATLVLMRPLDILLAGEEEAAASGVHVPGVRLTALGAAALATGAAVALTGVIAFIGLIAPTLLRPLTGPNQIRLAPAAMILGAAILVAADAVGRRLAAPAEIPVGVISALFGAVLLLVLLVRMLRGMGA